MREHFAIVEDNEDDEARLEVKNVESDQVQYLKPKAHK